MKSGWLRSPRFDLLFLANVLWPALLLPGMSADGSTAVDFWQIYFLTLPHRWITLVLVAIDPDRRGQRSFVLTGLALMFAVMVGGAYLGTSAFLCLGAIDYVWNAWHFASQHAGVLRIYSKQSGGGIAWLERWGIRLFITYTICRTAGEILTQQVGWSSDILPMPWIDWGMIAIPIALLVTNGGDWRRERWPKMIYLASVLTLYTGYLISGNQRASTWIVCFATAASLFHATEYLAIVSHYALRRNKVGSEGLMRQVSRFWVPLLALYMLGLGMLGWWMTRMSGPWGIAWQGLNLWAAFTHYAWDGMIWKLRQPATAQALGSSA